MHNVTIVERIIDRIEMVPPQGDFFVFRGTQRIRFWGEPIPEPTTSILLMISVLALATGSEKCRTPNLNRKNIDLYAS